MTNTIDTAAIETIRDFAISHNEFQFAHLCTAALNDEGWAIDRVIDALGAIDVGISLGWDLSEGFAQVTLAQIRVTDTTRPDGLVARSFVP